MANTERHSLLQVREAANELGVTPVTVRKAIAGGELRAFRLGERGRYRIRANDLEEFLRSVEPEQR